MMENNVDIILLNKTDDEKIDETKKHTNIVFSFEFDIPILECIIYVLVWSFSLIYSLYVLYLELVPHRSAFINNQLIQDGLFGWQQDAIDSEWHAMMQLYKSSLLWYLAFLIISQLTNQSQQFITLFSISYLFYIFGFIKTCFLIIPIYLFYIVHLLRNKYFSIVFGVGMIYLFNSSIGSNLVSYISAGEEFEEILLQGGVCWIICRTISYSVDSLATPYRAHLDISKDLFELMSYCLYFPSMLRGPFLTYEKFASQFKLRESRKFSVKRLILTIVLLLRYLFWFAFTIVAYHTFHANSIIYMPEKINKFSSWAVCGLILCLGMIFMLKYTVIYGVARTVSFLDGIQMPAPPRCIVCLPLYSYFWRYFDPGMYMFIKSYLYIPWLKNEKHILAKIFGTFICFFFVFIWHGLSKSMFAWTALNFFGILIEMLCREISKSNFYDCFIQHISQPMFARLKALFVAPLFVMSALSTAFFLTGFEVGNICVDKILISGFPNTTLSVLAIFYCASHVGLIVIHWLTKHASSL